MSMTMKKFGIGGQVYSVEDETAREKAREAQKAAAQAQEELLSVRKIAESYAEDINKLKLASITPDTTLKISGAAADSKSVGDAIEGTATEIDTKISKAKEELRDKIDNISPDTIGAVGVGKIANNLTTSKEGYVLDARQAAILTALIEKASEMKLSGTTEGSILSVDANGYVVASSRKISGMGTGATYSLDDTTLYITTL